MATKAEKDAEAKRLLARVAELAGEAEEPATEGVTLAHVAPPSADIPDMAITEEQAEAAAAPQLPEEPEKPEPQTDFERFLAMLSPDVLESVSREELLADFQKAEAEAREERRRKYRAAAAKKAKDAARAAAGLITARDLERERLTEFNEQLVRVTIRMPRINKQGGIGHDGPVIDGVKYVHGGSYVMPRARALVVQSILHNLHQHEMEFKGEGILSEMRQMHAYGINITKFTGAAA